MSTAYLNLGIVMPVSATQFVPPDFAPIKEKLEFFKQVRKGCLDEGFFWAVFGGLWLTEIVC